MKLLFSKVWKDPVWSKVIASAILAALALLYSYLSFQTFGDAVSFIGAKNIPNAYFIFLILILIVLSFSLLRKQNDNKSSPVAPFIVTQPVILRVEDVKQIEVELHQDYTDLPEIIVKDLYGNSVSPNLVKVNTGIKHTSAKFVKSFTGVIEIKFRNRP